MRTIGIIAGQVFLCVLITGAVLPMVVYYAPDLAGSRVGPWLPFLVIAVLFVVLRLLWPRRKEAK